MRNEAGWLAARLVESFKTLYAALDGARVEDRLASRLFVCPSVPLPLFNALVALEERPDAAVAGLASAMAEVETLDLPFGVLLRATAAPALEAEARRLGAHEVHNTKRDGVLKKIAGSLDLIISTINVPLDVPGLLETLAPLGRLHVVGAVLEPLAVPAFGLIMGQKSVSGFPVGSPSAIDRMLEFSAGHAVASADLAQAPRTRNERTRLDRRFDPEKSILCGTGFILGNIPVE